MPYRSMVDHGVITVRTGANSSEADSIRAQLDELVVAYEVVEGDTALVIEDGDRRISGDAIPGYLAELRDFVALWRKFQTDACYLEDDGSIC